MKTVPIISADEAAALVTSGDTLLVGGFGMTGNPVHLVHALAETATRDLTFVGNNVGEAGLSGGRLLRNGQLKKAVGSFFTSNREAVAAAQDGSLEVQLIPQGTLAEAIRAGGAGIGGFYTPTAVGTVIAGDTDTRTLNGQEMVFVPALRGDVAFVRAWRADRAGNLQYRLTEQNFNPAMATAAQLVVAEVEEIVEVGEIAPEHVHTPGLYVDALVHATLTLADLGSSADVRGGAKRVDEARMNMARRALQELRPGDVVNLGIGIPTLVADLITPEMQVNLHTENGMLGVGPAPEGGGAMDYPVNAGKIPVTALPGASYFDSAHSFGMIRGGHVDVAVMGGLQVDEAGNLANWAVPGKPLLGVGGAMDLASGAKKLIVTMTHTDPDGTPKIVPECTLPLTARGAVDMVITDKAVFEMVDGQLTLTGLMPGTTLQDVRLCTGASFIERLGA
ncbi:3-oxoacid CoA-transferase [Deinococcus humi]|uniref:3-oxoacid CoA-transferase n=1 Tax=Deinococcus humi TaxID=662880 RepID=A0A7W8JVS1_9DEIO|nr:3-oxoacid CoA-transferase [Deinococcus humi]GGO28268.1 succinyl-CoA--3-ketoacid-CoA transferase [Deinococcus humi]